MALLLITLYLACRHFSHYSAVIISWCLLKPRLQEGFCQALPLTLVVLSVLSAPLTHMIQERELLSACFIFLSPQGLTGTFYTKTSQVISLMLSPSLRITIPLSKKSHPPQNAGTSKRLLASDPAHCPHPKTSGSMMPHFLLFSYVLHLFTVAPLSGFKLTYQIIKSDFASIVPAMLLF